MEVTVLSEPSALLLLPIPYLNTFEQVIGKQMKVHHHNCTWEEMQNSSNSLSIYMISKKQYRHKSN